MADIVSDGMTRISWLTSLTSTSSPANAELTAGVALESFITPGGLDVSGSTDAVDNSALNSSQNTELAGRRKDSISLEFKSQGQSAAPWTTFAGKPTGYIVIRRGVASATAWAASQKVQVYPAQAGDRFMQKPAANELEKFTVQFFISGTVVDATVA